MDSGIYFVAVEGKQGTGNYSLFTFLSTYDVNYELNDSIATATEITNSNEITVNGVIDNPNDYDVYKIECTSDELAKIELVSPTGENYKLVYYDGSSFYNINNYIKLNKGTHYFIVSSNGGSYSQTKPYTFKKLSSLTILI